MKRFLVLFLLPVIALTFAACRTTDAPIAENMTPGELFQEAQTASSEFGDYERALLYYNTFIERFPDEPLLIIEAEYEIALLYHKMEDDVTALKLFNGILEKYQTPDAAVLPAWPNVLSQKMIDIIEGTAEPQPESEEAAPTE